MAGGPSLLDRRFLLLSGKGGVGRTTVAAALADLAARRGRRVLLAQMDSPERLTRLLGAPCTIGPVITQVRAGLFAVNMTARAALHEYGVLVLRYASIARALFENRAVRGFLAAVPGLDAYAMLGKVWWHTTETERGRPKYDLVILDGPASGHALTTLRIPHAILDAMPKGPLARDAAAMLDLFRDPARAAFVPVTLPEELPARETADLVPRVRDGLRMPLGPLLVNGVLSDRHAPSALDGLLERLPPAGAPPPLAPVLRAAELLRARRRQMLGVLDQLRRDPGLPLVELPALPTTDLGPEEIEDLADVLEASGV
jgi:Mrp family chromosome partitioning ATPase